MGEGASTPPPHNALPLSTREVLERALSFANVIAVTLYQGSEEKWCDLSIVKINDEDRIALSLFGDRTRIRERKWGQKNSQHRVY